MIRGGGTFPIKEMDYTDYIFCAAARALIRALGGENNAGPELKSISIAWAQAARTRDAEKDLIASIGEKYKKTEAARVKARRAMRENAPGTDYRAILIELCNAIEGVDGEMPKPLERRKRNEVLG